MMITGTDIVIEARHWIGTPFHHAARVHQVGVDCIGLPLVSAYRLGVEIPEELKRVDYQRGPDDHTLLDELDRMMIRIEGEPAVGNVCLFNVPSNLYEWPWHCGIRSDLGLLHADAASGIKRVHEDRRWGFWRRRMIAAYRIPGVTDG